MVARVTSGRVSSTGSVSLGASTLMRSGLRTIIRRGSMRRGSRPRRLLSFRRRLPPAREDPTLGRLNLLALKRFHGQLYRSAFGVPRAVARGRRTRTESASAGMDGPDLLRPWGIWSEHRRGTRRCLETSPGDHVLNTLRERRPETRIQQTDKACNVSARLAITNSTKAMPSFMRLVGGGNPRRAFPREAPGAALTRFPYVSANVIDAIRSKPADLLGLTCPKSGGRGGRVSRAVSGARHRSGPQAGHRGSEVHGTRPRLSIANIREIHAAGAHIVSLSIRGSRRRATGATNAQRTGASRPELLSIHRRIDGRHRGVSPVTRINSRTPRGNAHGVHVLRTQAILRTERRFADIDSGASIRRAKNVVSKSARIVTTYLDTGPGLV